MAMTVAITTGASREVAVGAPVGYAPVTGTPGPGAGLVTVTSQGPEPVPQAPVLHGGGGSVGVLVRLQQGEVRLALLLGQLTVERERGAERAQSVRLGHAPPLVCLALDAPDAGVRVGGGKRRMYQSSILATGTVRLRCRCHCLPPFARKEPQAQGDLIINYATVSLLTMNGVQRESTLELMRWIVWGQRRIAEDWIRERGLTHEQSAVLAYLSKNPNAIQRDVARAMRTSAPSVSRLLAGLERRGLVERQTQENDTRSRRVHVTPAGSELIQGFEEAMDRVEESILAPLDAAGQARLHEFLEQLASRIEPPRSP